MWSVCRPQWIAVTKVKFTRTLLRHHMASYLTETTGGVRPMDAFGTFSSTYLMYDAPVDIDTGYSFPFPPECTHHAAWWPRVLVYQSQQAVNFGNVEVLPPPSPAAYVSNPPHGATETSDPGQQSGESSRMTDSDIETRQREDELGRRRLTKDERRQMCLLAQRHPRMTQTWIGGSHPCAVSACFD